MHRKHNQVYSSFHFYQFQFMSDGCFASNRKENEISLQQPDNFVFNRQYFTFTNKCEERKGKKKWMAISIESHVFHRFVFEWLKKYIFVKRNNEISLNRTNKIKTAAKMFFISFIKILECINNNCNNFVVYYNISRSFINQKLSLFL